MNFFMRNVERIGTVLVTAGDSPAMSRALETASHAVRDMGRPTLIVTNQGSPLTALDCTVAALPAPEWTYSNLLTQFAPLCLLMGYLGELLGEEDGRGCKGPWSFAAGGAGITQSEILVK